jgi:hypothetical protein
MLVKVLILYVGVSPSGKKFILLVNGVRPTHLTKKEGKGAALKKLSNLKLKGGEPR